MKLPESSTERAILILVWTTALVALWGSAHINAVYLEKVPHVQDSVNTLFQARVLAMGKFFIEAPDDTAKSFASEYIIVRNGRRYCHVPFVVPTLFMLGFKLGITWLVNPIIAMLSVLLVYKIGKDNFSPMTGLFASIFLVSSPFFLVMSASFMSHPTGLFLTAVCVLLFLKHLDKPSYRNTCFLGCSIGLLFNCRPLNAVSMGIIVLVFYFRNRVKFNKLLIRHLVILVICASLGVGIYFIYSAQLTGKSMQFLTDKHVKESTGPTNVRIINRFVNSLASMGVGKSNHTPAKGLGCVKALLELFHTFSLNWPGWFNLSFFLIPLASFKLTEKDRFLYGAFLIIPIFYMLYWRSAIMYGPRYIYEIMPMTVLLSARGIDYCLEAADALHENSFLKLYNTRLAAKAVSLIALFGLIGWLVYSNLNQYFIESSYNLRKQPPVSLVPMKVSSLRNFNGIRNTIPNAVEAHGVNNALVFVSERRWQGFGSVTSYNSPTLDTDIVYAKDLGDKKNLAVIEMFPGKDVYWTKYSGAKLHTYEYDVETKQFIKELLDNSAAKKKSESKPTFTKSYP